MKRAAVIPVDICIGLLACLICTSAFSQSNSVINRADSLFTAGSWHEAAAAYELALKSDNKNGRAWYRLGSAYQRQNHFSRAIAAYKKSLELTSVIPPIFIRSDLAKTYSQSKDSLSTLALLKEMVANGYQNFPDLQAAPEYAWLKSSPTFISIVSRATSNAYPCANNPKNHEFDFWLGEWNVYQTGTDYLVGEQKIEKASGGCLILENWTAHGFPNDGKSMNFISPKTGKWEQVWMGSGGQYLNYYNGVYRNSALEYEGDGVGQSGNKVLFRLTYFNQGGETVRQLLQQSLDESKTWTTLYDFTYRKKM